MHLGDFTVTSVLWGRVFLAYWLIGMCYYGVGPEEGHVMNLRLKAVDDGFLFSFSVFL